MCAHTGTNPAIVFRSTVLHYLSDRPLAAIVQLALHAPGASYTPIAHGPTMAIESLRGMAARLDAACEMLSVLGPHVIHGCGVATANAATDLPLTLIALEVPPNHPKRDSRRQFAESLPPF